jgi:hypothetical protein
LIVIHPIHPNTSLTLLQSNPSKAKQEKGVKWMKVSFYQEGKKQLHTTAHTSVPIRQIIIQATICQVAAPLSCQFVACTLLDSRAGMPRQRRLHGCICSLIAAVTLLNGYALAADTFNEKLLIRPLPDGKVVSHFEFVTEGTDDTWQGHTYGHDNATLTSARPSRLVSIGSS